MRMRTMVLTGFILLLGGATFAEQMPATAVSREFPQVLATLNLRPGQSATVTVPDAYFKGVAAGEMTIYVPANAFQDPVRFQVLTSSNGRWDGMVPMGLKVVANFAYRVVDTKTGKPVEAFRAPVQYTVSDGMIDANSVYWAVKPGDTPKIIDANAHSTIHGTVLSHPTPTAAVGWIITTPKADLKGAMGGSASNGSASSTSAMSNSAMSNSAPSAGAGSNSGTMSGSSTGNGM
jgi:hypothetical protein